MSELKWQPVGNKILVRCEGVEQVSKGGIILPEQSTDREKMKQMYGTVVAIGPLAYNDQRTIDEDGTVKYNQQWVKIGDRVKFQQYAGHLHLEENDPAQYRLMHDLDILMVYKA